MKQLAVALATLLLTGCASLGPGAIQGSRTDYNVALRQTEDEQLLLNLVRLRYRDQVLFLEASALNTQFTFQRSAEAGAEFGDVDTLYGLRGRVAVEEKPTVTYTPLQGGDFVERVLSPIRQETLFLLRSSGWSTDRAFRTLVQQMNGVRNAPRASGPTPDSAPEYEQFARVTALLRALELQDMVAGGRRGDDLVLQFPPQARTLPEYLELMQALELDPGQGVYPVTAAADGAQPGAITVRLRSFVGVMYFLSQAVDVPARDIEAGRVTVTRDASGRPFDWTRVTAGLMRIRSSGRRPENPAVAVFYRGSWFYIDDADLDSKATFSMLGQVFALQSGNVERIAPVLTLPVGG
jgi:hypothetical protein